MTRGSLRTVLRLALGDLLAVVEHRDLLGDAHDHLHVVLDEQDRQLALVAQLAHELASAPRTPAGSCRPSARRAAAASGPTPARGRSPRGAGRRRRGWTRRRRGGAGRRRRSRAARAPSPAPRAPRAAPAAGAGSRRRRRPHARVAADEHVLDRRHRAEQADVLERARDAGAVIRSGRLAVMSLPSNDHLARARLVQPGEHVEERRLAGAVGADDRDDRALRHAEGDVVDGGQAAEDLRQAASRGSRPRRRQGRLGCGLGCAHARASTTVSCSSAVEPSASSAWCASRVSGPAVAAPS